MLKCELKDDYLFFFKPDNTLRSTFWPTFFTTATVALIKLTWHTSTSNVFFFWNWISSNDLGHTLYIPNRVFYVSLEKRIIKNASWCQGKRENERLNLIENLQISGKTLTVFVCFPACRGGGIKNV